MASRSRASTVRIELPAILFRWPRADGRPGKRRPATPARHQPGVFPQRDFRGQVGSISTALWERRLGVKKNPTVNLVNRASSVPEMNCQRCDFSKRCAPVVPDNVQDDVQDDQDLWSSSILPDPFRGSMTVHLNLSRIGPGRSNAVTLVVIPCRPQRCGKVLGKG
jgi:hypothetical protein